MFSGYVRKLTIAPIVLKPVDKYRIIIIIVLIRIINNNNKKKNNNNAKKYMSNSDKLLLKPTGYLFFQRKTTLQQLDVTIASSATEAWAPPAAPRAHLGAASAAPPGVGPLPAWLGVGASACWDPDAS